MTGLLLLTALAAPIQTRDTVRADTLPRTRLEAIEVTVARRRESLARLPMAAGVVTTTELRDAQPTLGLDEALTLVPGVHVANRWNFSLDQRLSIRGFGSRANFGLRGVKVLLDGVPQTLPDGQSQLTNVEFAALERVEVLRGAASALYGNASGGALLLQSSRPGPEGSRARLRLEAGSFGSRKWLSEVEDRAGRVAWLTGASRFVTDGFRQQSAADLRQYYGALFWTLSPATDLTVRAAWGDAPRAENPGALTAQELAARWDTAAANNILRGADKAVDQRQVSVRIGQRLSSGGQVTASVFGLWRDLDNPLATPPPGPPSPTAGTYNTIDRSATGLRLEAALPVHPTFVLTVGADVQRMADERENRRSDGGLPTDAVLARQREVITEIGPFAQGHWSRGRLTVDGGLRYDRVRFVVEDRWLEDGADQGGRRTMEALSGNVGASVEAGRRITLYGLVSTAFETPTSTELVNLADATVGFNPDLGPQRAVSVEAGIRGGSERLAFTLSGFTIGIRDAIIPVREQSGRAFFANAGRTRNRGLEAGLTATPGGPVTVRAAYTLADYTFTDYRIPMGQAVDTLDGNRLAGVPQHFARLGVDLGPVAGLRVSWDQLLSSSLYADDRNTIEVDHWGAGVSSLRASWAGRLRGLSLGPFVAVQNAFGRRYVGSVTINGFGGRVFEPAPGRNVWVGVELGVGTGEGQRE